MDGQLRSTRAAVEIAGVGRQYLTYAFREPRDEEVEKAFRRGLEALSTLASSRFGLSMAAHRYPVYSIDWLLEHGGGALSREHYEEFIRISGDTKNRTVLLERVDVLDADARGAIFEALPSLVRDWSASIARTGTISDECRQARNQFSLDHSAAFADWLLDPLESTAAEVEDAVRDIEGMFGS
jgi:hypothetical protein